MINFTLKLFYHKYLKMSILVCEFIMVIINYKVKKC